MKSKDEFYPTLLATVPPKILTREEVDSYWEKRELKIVHIAATNPVDERIDGR